MDDNESCEGFSAKNWAMRCKTLESSIAGHRKDKESLQRVIDETSKISGNIRFKLTKAEREIASWKARWERLKGYYIKEGRTWVYTESILAEMHELESSPPADGNGGSGKER
jgi:hypothetical protein